MLHQARRIVVQTASTNEADQTHVPGATAVRVLGALFILQGGYQLYNSINTVVMFVQREIDPSDLPLTFFVGAVVGLLTLVAGIVLVRLDRMARGFGLVICSIALADQIYAFVSTLDAVKLISRFATLGLLFWLLPFIYMALFLGGIVLLARWHPPRLPS
jgi:hypothetical protein